jgi:hypothetical protein
MDLSSKKLIIWRKTRSQKYGEKTWRPPFYVDDQGNGELALSNMDKFPPKPPKGPNPDIAPFPKKKYSVFKTLSEFPSSFRPDFPTKIQAMSRIYLM